MNTRRTPRFPVRTALALTLALGSTAARAQLALPTTDDGDEVPLPDINAIEHGAKARASVSFKAPTPPPGESTAPGGPPPLAPPASGTETIRRLEVAPPPALGGRAGIYGLDAGIPGLTGPDEASAPGQMPEQHVVKKGDTLTSVCEQYFADPWCWPRLWAENPQVTNPHWIFPGDVLRLRGTSPIGPPARPSGMHLTSNRGPLQGQAVVLRETGFIDPESLADSARITGSREEKIMLASGDQAYVGFPASKPLHAGDRYTVFVADTDHPILSPETGQLLGYLVRVYGDILVDQIAEGNVARGALLDLSEPVERGYAVSPRVRLFRQVEPKPAAVNLEARVVASFSPGIMLAAENFVVLSRGSKDGLVVGNRSFVVRRGDGYRSVLEGWDKMDASFPKEVVAELWVMDVRDHAAVAWVARSTKELRVGEVAELRRGH